MSEKQRPMRRFEEVYWQPKRSVMVSTSLPVSLSEMNKSIRVGWAERCNGA